MGLRNLARIAAARSRRFINHRIAPRAVIGAPLWVALMLAVVGVAGEGLAASPFEEGRQIMQAVYDRGAGDNMSAEVRMILVDGNEKRTVRNLRTYRKAFGEAAFQVFFVLDPEDLKNSGLLSYDYSAPGKADDQWWYEPGQKKARRLAGAERSGSFMGSDFNFADLTRADMASFSYRLMKEREEDGTPTWQIQVLPKTREAARESGYAKSVLWVRKDNLFVVRAVRWVYNNRRIKHMRVTRLAEIDGIWMAVEKQMVTREGVRKVHSTILQFGNILFDQKLKKRLFTLRGLEKGLN